MVVLAEVKVVSLALTVSKVQAALAVLRIFSQASLVEAVAKLIQMHHVKEMTYNIVSI